MIFLLISGLLFLLFVLFLMLTPQQFFMRHFYMFRKLRLEMRNRLDYFAYIVVCEWHIQKIKASYTAIKAALKIYSVLNIFAVFMRLILNQKFSELNDIILNNLFNAVIVGIGLILSFFDFFKNSSDRYTTIEVEQSAYNNVDAPDGWNKLVLKPDASIAVWNDEPVFVNSDVDSWLLSNKAIGMTRSKQYEQALKKQIYEESSWKNIYSLFLRRNYLASNYNGRQFHNESKFGISSELDPQRSKVNIHRTCYYDSYLTNIIPGRKLLKNEEGTIIVDTKDLMPYNILTKDKKSKSEPTRKLLKIGSGKLRANEPGVSTLILVDGRTLFWTQNLTAQSSINRIAPSGSGSADWSDCEPFLNDSNGFRKALAYGMQRELWEEAYSRARQIDESTFMEYVETRITGYFRWLQKAGKSEFVGITRFLKNENGDYIPGFDNFIANTEEVKKDPILKEIGTVGKLLENLPDFQEGRNGMIAIGNYSVPCAMAILSLRNVCMQYCTTCPYKESNCFAQCNVNTEDVLFPPGVAISLKQLP